MMADSIDEQTPPVLPVPILDGVRWSAGFIRAWISTLATPKIIHTSTADDRPVAIGNLDLLPSADSIKDRDSTNKDSLPRPAVLAVFQRSFLQSVLDAHKKVDCLLENGLIVAQCNKYGHQLPRVNAATYGYYTHYVISPLPDISFSRALKDFQEKRLQVGASREEITADIEAAIPPRHQSLPITKDELILVTEEVYLCPTDPSSCADEPRHHFKMQSVNAHEISNLTAQGVFIFSAKHWESLNVSDLTYHDYFLACDEKCYSTFLDFIARLHILTSPSYVSVAPDGRLFLADILAMIYAANDSSVNAQACDLVQPLLGFPDKHPELTKDMLSITVRGPNDISVQTYLATPPQIRRFMLALEAKCRKQSDPQFIYNWAIRIRNYVTLRLPSLCKGAVDLAISSLKTRKVQQLEVQTALAAAENYREDEPGVPIDCHHFTVCHSEEPQSRLVLSPKLITVQRTPYSSHPPTTPLGDTQPEGYILCCLRSRIDTDCCGCSLFRRYGDSSHDIGFDLVIRASELAHVEDLATEISGLFHSLIWISEGSSGLVPVLRNASKIVYYLRQLDLLHDANFDNSTLSINNLCHLSSSVWTLFAEASAYAPLVRLHNYLMKPPGEGSSYDRDTEITVMKLVAVSIACCASVVLRQGQFQQGQTTSIIKSPMLLKNSYLDVPEASMTINIVLKALENAKSPLLMAVLGTVQEQYLTKMLGHSMKEIVDRSPLIAACTPDAINERNKPECSCVVCVAVATTQLNGTWQTDLLRPELLKSSATIALLREPSAGAADLLSALVVARRPFISQRNSNYVLHNAPQLTSVPSNDSSKIFSQKFDYSITAINDYEDEILEAYWNSDDMDATSRVRSAMIIGAQSTGIDMETFPFFAPRTSSTQRSPSGDANSIKLRYAKFLWPGWLCDLIVREAHEQVSAGTAHWAAVRAVTLADAKLMSSTSPLGRTTAVDQIQETTINSDPPELTGPSKHSIIQPHPAYAWPLDCVPAAHEIVLLDVKEQRRICLTLEEIAALQPKPTFASHIWETSEHPDPTGRQISNILKWNGLRYLWLDYVCLPQGTRNAAEAERFQRTLHQLSRLQPIMTTRTLDDQYDKVDWQIRGWCIVEAIVGNVKSPLGQAVYRHFQKHRALGEVFLRLGIRVTNQKDVKVLQTVLGDWIKIQQAHSAQQSERKPTSPEATGQSMGFPLLVSVGVSPSHKELESAKAAARRHREVEAELYGTSSTQADPLENEDTHSRAATSYVESTDGGRLPEYDVDILSMFRSVTLLR